MNFGNIATAMITPFDKKGNIDFKSYQFSLITC